MYSNEMLMVIQCSQRDFVGQTIWIMRTIEMI